MIPIILSLAFAFGTSLCLKRLPFPHDWIVGAVLAANFAMGALYVELSAHSQGFAMLSLPLALFDAGFLLYLFGKMLFEFPDEGDASAPARIWTALAYGFSGLLLFFAPLLGSVISYPIYFWLHRAEFEELVREEPQRPRAVRSVTLGFKWHVQFLYDPTHGKAPDLWGEKKPFERAQWLSGNWYSCSPD